MAIGRGLEVEALPLHWAPGTLDEGIVGALPRPRRAGDTGCPGQNTTVAVSDPTQRPSLHGEADLLDDARPDCLAR